MNRQIELYRDFLFQIVDNEQDGVPDFDDAVRILNEDYDMFPDLSELVVLKLAFKEEFDNADNQK